MSDANGYALILSGERAAVFRSQIDAGELFAESVPDFVHSRSYPLLCLVLLGANEISYVAQGRRGVKGGTGLRRINVIEPLLLEPAILVQDVLLRTQSTFRNRVQAVLQEGGIFTPKSFAAFVAALIQTRPSLAVPLARFSAARATRIARIPAIVRENLAFQKEAVLTALAIAKDPREDTTEWQEVIQDWDPVDDVAQSATSVQQASFLDGLAVARIREDPMVTHDLMNFPGYELIRTMPFNSAVFASEKTRVTIVMANRQPLERQYGADLIYFNETFRSFVMVQYKAMKDTGDDACFRLPDDQLDLELERMETTLLSLQACPSDETLPGFRLNENPFFLKLCRKIVLDPNSSRQIEGMYFPLNYWKRLASHQCIGGDRGGRAVSYKNAQRYLDNSEFRSMVAGAWVGSTCIQSSVLEEAIRAILESGRTAVIAIKTDIAATEAAA